MEALRIRIPQRYQSGIAKLVWLDEELVNELAAVLDDLPSTFNLDHLKLQIISKVNSISSDDLKEIIDALEALHVLRYDRELSLDDFIEKLLQAMNSSGHEKLQLRGPNYSTFKEKLSILLTGKLLSIAVQARNLVFEHDYVFGRTRVITDIRTIFEENIEHRPVASVIVHMLKVHYIQGQDHKDLFLALDTADIAVLIDVLKQAQEKAETLKSTLTNIPYIDAQ